MLVKLQWDITENKVFDKVCSISKIVIQHHCFDYLMKCEMFVSKQHHDNVKSLKTLDLPALHTV